MSNNHTAPAQDRQGDAMVLLEDCPPTGGCFTLWPTSHHKLFPLFTTSQGNFPKDITNFATLGPGGHMSSPIVTQTLSDVAAMVPARRV